MVWADEDKTKVEYISSDNIYASVYLSIRLSIHIYTPAYIYIKIYTYTHICLPAMCPQLKEQAVERLCLLRRACSNINFILNSCDIPTLKWKSLPLVLQKHERFAVLWQLIYTAQFPKKKKKSFFNVCIYVEGKLKQGLEGERVQAFVPVRWSVMTS